MSQAIKTLEQAQALAMKIRPKVGGFPYLAEVLRQAGVQRNLWTLPSCQAVFITKHGNVISQMPPLTSGSVEIPSFDEAALIKALRRDQAGESSFPAFLEASWAAGVVSYEVDFEKRHVIYYGVQGESYREAYPSVSLEALPASPANK